MTEASFSDSIGKTADVTILDFAAQKNESIRSKFEAAMSEAAQELGKL
jgi:hypothetical protein